MANKKAARGKPKRLPPKRGATAKRLSSNAGGDDLGKANSSAPQSSPSRSLQGQGDLPKTPLARQSRDIEESTPGSVPHSLRQGAARGTRSARRQDIVTAFKWEALEIERSRQTAGSPLADRNSKGRKDTTNLVRSTTNNSSSTELYDMSRSRPRGPPVPRDNGLAANEETDMWNKIVQDLRKAKEKNDKQKELAEQITILNEKIAREGNSKYYFSSFFCYQVAIMHIYVVQLTSSANT